jgi:hypothetical protein
MNNKSARSNKKSISSLEAVDVVIPRIDRDLAVGSTATQARAQKTKQQANSRGKERMRAIHL